MDKGKEYSWKDIEVTLCGRVIKPIPAIYFKSLEDLELELAQAEADEDYGRCIELRDFIKEHYNQ